MRSQVLHCALDLAAATRLSPSWSRSPRAGIGSTDGGEPTDQDAQPGGSELDA